LGTVEAETRIYQGYDMWNLGIQTKIPKLHPYLSPSHTAFEFKQ